ncbi:Uncharacterized protein GcM3_091020 [Golovinomyces cichoracearum]|uniref:Coiled-coil domain-containing protein 174 n=1 Tax=Golovinomyces cichoracearum TaxID=62708 RepID=A0A420IHC3_9PEZI|nr:Uncharacterized protein GcM3_091020 [Golovinomyces cichoracearum]
MNSSNNLNGSLKTRNKPKEISSTNVLDFTSTLSPLISSARTKSVGRPRASQKKPGIFSAHNKTLKKRAAQDLTNVSSQGLSKSKNVGALDIENADEEKLYRSKRKMEAKAKAYAQMKRNEVSEDTEVLVDFDRKWAERQEMGFDSDSDSGVESVNGHGEMLEYEDEFGRVRLKTRSEVEKLERQKKIALMSTEELGRMSARPEMPSKINYGDTVQSMAFNPDEQIAARMEELAKKRDRSLTPPEMRHYEADKEVRTKGVGFFNFSKDEAIRNEEMRALEKERIETETRRKEREEKKKERLLEIEERRKTIQQKRAKKQADSFLDNLDFELKFAEASK